MDIASTTAPKSDQQNFDDYQNTSRTVTVSEVRAGSSEQPVEIHLAEHPGRPYKPSKSMRRVLVAAWGSDAEAYVGRRMKLVGDPTVRFGGAVVGGIKIAALSHIEKRLTISLTVTKGKRAPHAVDPLPAAPTPPKPDPNLLDTRSPLAAKMYAAITASDIDKAEVPAWISNVIGRDIAGTKEMTPAEAEVVLSALAERAEGGA